MSKEAEEHTLPGSRSASRLPACRCLTVSAIPCVLVYSSPPSSPPPDDDDVHYYIGERLKLKTESLDRAPGENVVITLMRFADNERTLVCIKILTPAPAADLWSTRENRSCTWIVMMM